MINASLHLIASCVTVRAHDLQRVQEAVVLRGGLDVHQVEQPEQQDAVLGVDRPEQWQVVAAMPGGDGFALLCQGRNATLLRQQRPDLASEGGVVVLLLLGFQHLAEDADQGFLHGPVLVVQVLELLLGRSLGPPNAAQQHLDQLVTATHAGLAQQGEQQRVSFARLGDVEQVAHLQRRGFGGKLT